MVENISHANASGFTTAFYINDSLLIQRPVNALAARATAYLPDQQTPAITEEPTAVRVCADTYNLITESDESNNCNTVTLKVTEEGNISICYGEENADCSVVVLQENSESATEDSADNAPTNSSTEDEDEITVPSSDETSTSATPSKKSPPSPRERGR